MTTNAPYITCVDVHEPIPTNTAPDALPSTVTSVSIVLSTSVTMTSVGADVGAIVGEEDVGIVVGAGDIVGVVGSGDIVVVVDGKTVGSEEGVVEAVGVELGAEVVGAELLGLNVLGPEVLGADNVGTGADVVGAIVLGADKVGADVVGAEEGVPVGLSVDPYIAVTPSVAVAV